MNNYNVFRTALASILFVFLAATSASACSCFLLEDNGRLVVGRNFDWFSGDAIVLVNKRGLAKTALAMPPAPPAAWGSRYGSITINQIGRDWPMEGMNEKGLVVATLWLEQTVYPEPDHRPAVSELQWIQYQLDNHTTVGEVITSDTLIRISKSSTPLHFFVADAHGNAAVIEFIDGQQIAYTEDDLPVKVITNSTYDSSLEYSRSKNLFGGDTEFVQSDRSLDRFVEAAFRAGELKPTVSGRGIDYAYDILDNVKIASQEGWSSVYDIENMTIRFKSVSHPNVKTVELRGLDFDCDSPVQFALFEPPSGGDLTESLADYTVEMNRRLVFDCFRVYSAQGVIDDMPEFIIESIARQPFMFECGSVSEKR